jgi:hypothetical protein
VARLARLATARLLAAAPCRATRGVEKVTPASQPVPLTMMSGAGSDSDARGRAAALRRRAPGGAAGVPIYCGKRLLHPSFQS